MDVEVGEASHIDVGEDSDTESSGDESKNKAIASLEKENNGNDKPSMFGTGSIMKQLRQMGLLNSSKKRAATRQYMIGGATAFIDQDNSGDYDPTEEKRAARRRSLRRRAKVVELLDDEAEEGNSKPKRSPKAKVFDGIVKFTLKSQAGLAYLRSITPGPDSEDENSDENEEELSEDDKIVNSGGRKRRSRIVKTKTTIPQRADGLTLGQLTIGHPQRRGCKACFVAGNDDCTLIDDGHDYPCEACEDADIDCELIVPPNLKRDCERCKAKRVQCSYRRNKGKDKTSCKACEDQNLVCIAGPLKENTRRINDVRAHSTPESQSLRAPKSPSPSPLPVRPRQYIWCNQCRGTPNMRCSLRTKQDAGPCRNCRKTNQHCQFVYIPASQLAAMVEEEANRIKTRSAKVNKSQAKNAVNHKRARRDDGEEDSPGLQTEKIYSELEQKVVKRQKRLGKNKGKNTTYSQFQSQLCYTALTSGRSGSLGFASSNTNKNKYSYGNTASIQLIGFTSGNRHIFITTAFCHPICFNYIPDPASKHPCSWCFNPLYGLHGLLPDYDLANPLSVEGFYDPSGHGFEEVMGGFVERGAKQSNMCIDCTSARVDVLSCQNHVIRQLTEAEKDGWVYSFEKFKKSSEAWLEGDLVGARYFIDAKWCSICPNFAEFKCAAPAEEIFGNGDYEHAYEDERGGCGMLLCANCAELAGKLIIGGLNGQRLVDGLVREVKTQQWQFEDGVRADASFLTSEGELLARLLLGFGEDDGSTESGAGGVSRESSLGSGSGSGDLAKSTPSNTTATDSEDLAELKKRDRVALRKAQRQERKRVQLAEDESDSDMKPERELSFPG